MGKEITISKSNVFTGTIIKLDLHEVLLENGMKACREIITHPGGVGIIPVTEDGQIFLVSQFRKPYEEQILEIPAGKLDKGESALDCAARELKEETGLTAARYTYLTAMYPTPGYTNEIDYLYKAEGLTQGETAMDEDEFLEIRKYPVKEALQMVKDGRIKDAKTIIAVLMTALDIF